MTSVTQSTTHRTISPEELQRGLIAAAEHLSATRDLLDRLNVFPVPDGDTGHNMVATFAAGVEALSGEQYATIRAIGESVTPLMTKQSRGNSGFILARFFDGFFAAIGDQNELSKALLAEAFAEGSYRVTTSLMTPIEGTALTIIGAMAHALDDATDQPAIEALKSAIGTARESLAKTPDQLPVLAKAGVIDSGALGFVALCEGIAAGITGEPFPVETEGRYRFEPRAGDVEPASQTNFRYCTELVLTDFRGPPRSEIRTFLLERGGSIALYTDDDLLKLHIHTNEPEEVIGFLAPHGTIETQKVEDMFEQIVSGPAPVADSSEVLAIVPGEGFVQLFADLGIGHALVCDKELPSVEQICTAIEAIPVQSVVVLPNDRNIIPAATLAADSTSREVTVLPTHTVVHGMSAAYGFSENAPAAENVNSMHQCMELAEAFSVYRASASTTFGSQSISAGSFFVSRRDEILAVNSDLGVTVGDALKKGAVPIEERANVTLYTGFALADDAVKALVKRIAQEFPHIEIEQLYGGQRRAAVIIGVE